MYLLQCLINVERYIYLYSTNKEQYNYPTRRNNDIAIMILRLAKPRNGSKYYGPKLCNVLPSSVRNLDEGLFKRILKTELLEVDFTIMM